MPQIKSPRQPSYRHHKGRNLAVVTLHGRDVYLGKYGSPESKQKYKRLMLEWLANDGAEPTPQPEELTVLELAAAYKRFAKRHYVRDGEPTETYANVRFVMRALEKSPYAATLAAEFGPLALKALRRQMTESGNSRRYINDQIGIIKRAFKWAVSEQMLPVTVYQALQTVEGLKRGRSEAKDHAPVQPVADDVLEATLPHLPPVVDDMVRLLRLLGCRPGELCVMRPCDVDRTGDVWSYRVPRHKTDHIGKSRTVYIGPRAQAIIAPYLLRAAEAYCFSPAESDAKRRAILHANRKTPLSCGNRPGTNRKRGADKRLGERYIPTALNRAIQRACDKADAAARESARAAAEAAGVPYEAGPPDTRLVPRWFTYQLRHSAATEVRKGFGLEAAQVILGHSNANITQIYAERDSGLAKRVMSEVG